MILVLTKHIYLNYPHYDMPMLLCISIFTNSVYKGCISNNPYSLLDFFISTTPYNLFIHQIWNITKLTFPVNNFYIIWYKYKIFVEITVVTYWFVWNVGTDKMTQVHNRGQRSIKVKCRTCHVHLIFLMEFWALIGSKWGWGI